MKGMPLPFDFEGKGVLDNLDLVVVSRNKRFLSDNINSPPTYFPSHNYFSKTISDNNFNFGEPTSVLDSARIPSRPTSSSTLSSSLGGASPGVAAAAAAADTTKWLHDSTTATSSIAAGADPSLLPIPPSLEIGTTAAAAAAAAPEKFAMEDWESVLSDSVDVSPSQEQTFLRWIMGDVEDPSMGSLNKALHIGGGPAAAPEIEFSAGFGTHVDQGFGAGECFLPNFPSNNNRSDKIGLASNPIASSNLKFSQNITMPNNLGPHHHHHQPAFGSSADMKPQIFNSQLLLNQHQSQQPQNPSFFFPLAYSQEQEQNIFGPPHPKRHNSGNGPAGPISKGPFTDTGQQQQELFMGRQNLQAAIPHQLQLLPHHYLPQRPAGPRPKTDELGQHSSHQIQQAIVDQIYKAAELVQTGNPVLAQGILARLNHQLSPIGKPFHRAAFYCKEALQLLLNNNTNPNLNPSPFSLVFKIGAYKSFSEISPLIQFANFTSNQAVLESIEGFDRVHIVDFDIGYGGQWASLMQELALKNGGSAPPSLKITALASPSTHDQLELGLTRENLIQFAGETNISFDFDVMSVDSLNSGSWSTPFENEAVVVNLPIGSLVNYELSAPFVLRFVKHLSPRIVVSVDRGCDRTDLPFANHIIHALQSYSNLFESLDAVNVNMDALQKIERFLLQPGIEKIVMGRFRAPEKTQHWRALFLSSGFMPVTFSNFTESQAECVIKRTPVRGFQVEKRQWSLVLCWQRKELISASAWRC